MKQYVELGKRILSEGELRHDRTGVGALSVFDAHMEFDLRGRFPLVTVKETRWKTAFLEMLWFLRGEPDTSWLNANGCKLWDAWALDKETGYLGPIYGRRLLVSAWNVSEHRLPRSRHRWALSSIRQLNPTTLVRSIGDCRWPTLQAA